MHKTLQSDVVRDALIERGLSQKDLASALGVSGQAVTNWLKGKDFPRPAKLLKMAATLQLTFDELVKSKPGGQPVIAFRKKGNAKTTLEHIRHATEMGMLLKPLVSYLPEQQSLRTLITSPTTNYHKLQSSVAETRDRLGIGMNAVLGYQHLIGEFKNCGAILVPVMWGKKNDHKNALHIRLPEEDVTFVLINLDTNLEDFKFWMAHELAHVYTPELSGSDEGEDFADAFAGALLFPEHCAEECYKSARRKTNVDSIIRSLSNCANEHHISINTVYTQVLSYCHANNLPNLKIEKDHLHAVRNLLSGDLVSDVLYEPAPPKPEVYIASCEQTFQSDFFNALKKMLHTQGTSSSYIQQILDISVHDAVSLHEELNH